MIESINESEIDQSHDHENKKWDHKYHVINLESSTILMLNRRLETMIAKSSTNLLIYYHICTHIVTLLRTLTVLKSLNDNVSISLYDKSLTS